MNYLLVGAGVLVAAVAILFACLFRRLNAPDRERLPNLEWCQGFSIHRYRPMERLFSEEDYQFLAAQCGYSPEMGRRLKAQRRRIFRHYLRGLSRDFSRLHTAARFMLLHAPQDRPDLAIQLFRQRLLFRYALLSVHSTLVLQTLGVGTVDVRRLVQALESMGSQFRQLAAVPQPSVA